MASKKYYYLKHTDSSGYTVYRRLTYRGVFGFVLNLSRGESLVIVKDTPGLERRLNNLPAVYEEQYDPGAPPTEGRKEGE